MATKLPKDTYVNQVVTLKGFRDNVYSSVDGSLVGYVKDGKFIQTIDNIPVAKKKEPKKVDKEYQAKIAKINALNAIPGLEQDAAYYKDVAENVNKSKSERDKARAQYESLQAEIAQKQKEAGVAEEQATAEVKKKSAEDAKGELPKLEKEYKKLQAQYDALINPTDPEGKGPGIKAKISDVVSKYGNLYKTAFNKPFPGVDVVFGGKQAAATTGSAVDDARLNVKPAAAAAPVAAQKPAAAAKTPAKTPTAASKAPTMGRLPGSFTPTPITETTGKMTPDQIFEKAISEFGAIDTIFKTNPELSGLMTRAVNEKWTPARWASELQNTNWFKSNATELQQRGFYKRQYNDLINAIPAGEADRQAKIDALDNSTTYGRGLASVKRLIQAEAIAEGAVIENEALNILAQDIYDNALEKDGLAIRNYVRAKIKYQPGKILSGKAGADLSDLKQTAMANGLDLDKAFGTSIQGWLQKLAAGESVETYKTIIRQAAKAGLPERVGSLLDNGVDLETIYTPYKNILANTLEINPASITLNDPTLRSAIGPEKEMSLFDYQRQLRKDPRWQYTNNARSETSDAVMKVLKDFGFQG